MGRFCGSTPDQSFWDGLLTTFASRSLEQSESPLQIGYPAFNGLAKAKRQSVFHRNLGGARGGIDSHHPVHLRKWLWSQKEPEPFIYLMERATGSPRVCFANPCFAAGHWPLRAALENAHAFSQLRTLPGFGSRMSQVQILSSRPYLAGVVQW